MPLLPIYLVNFMGGSLMIVLSLVAFHYARRLTKLEPKSVLWTYLFWLCMALLALAISRSAGNVLRFIFMTAGHEDIWDRLAPYSGGINTLAFTAVAVLTFYYYNVHAVIERVRNDARSLAQANRQLNEAQDSLFQLTQTLEQRVDERTRELRASEAKFRRFYESSKDMIFFCDGRSRISDINESGVRLLGYQDQDELIDQPLAGFFVQEEKWSRFYCTLASEGHVTDFEADWHQKDGAALNLLITASAIRDKNGRMQGFEGIAKDLTHFRRVTDQLIRSQNLASLGQLAAGVAHEINTPLGIILAYTQLQLEDFQNQPEVADTLRKVEKQTKICKRIVSDLLKFSRQSPGGEKKMADVNACLEDVFSVMEHSLHMDRIVLERHLSPELPEVFLDNERFRQVLVNIISNAHHAIGQDGTIGVWTRQAGQCRLEIVIGDTGCGIPPEIIGRIFDPFFTTKRVDQGTGLGLSVSIGIIQDNGGQIEVHSPPLDPELLKSGMRTAFHIYLPAS